MSSQSFVTFSQLTSRFLWVSQLPIIIFITVHMRNKWTVIKNRPLITQKTGCSRVTTSVHLYLAAQTSICLWPYSVLRHTLCQSIFCLCQKHLRYNRRSRQNLSHATFLHLFSPATPKPCSMKLSSFPRTMISCKSDITELKSDALLYPGNLSAKTICTDDLLSSISCTLFFIVFYIKIIVCIITSSCIRRRMPIS